MMDAPPGFDCEPESLPAPKVLRREFDRIAELTNDAYEAMVETGSHIGEKAYQDWAALLLRYHSAIVQTEGKGDRETPIPSMKA